MDGSGSAAWRVPLSDVLVDDELRAAALETLSSGWWSMGPRVEALEAAFAEQLGARHAIAVANGTAALHLALLACGCGPGDEVVLPSLNFVAAANVVRHAGARPVFCDVRGADDLNLDPGDVEAALTPRTKAVIALHYGGHACDIERLAELARERCFELVEDAAHAPAARLNGRALGTFGRAGCFSFFSNKNLPVGEGGMVVTDDDGVAGRLRHLRSHGMTTLTWDRHRGHASGYDVVTAGFNYRLDELRAAIGLVQLRRLEDGNARRGRLVARYRRLLDGELGITMPFAEAEDAGAAHHLAVAVLPAGISRDAVRRALAGTRIQTSVHYPPIHLFSAYRDADTRPLPRTEELAARILTLPLYPHLEEREVELVAAALLDAVAACLPERAAAGRGEAVPGAVLGRQPEHA
jgi:dTDP-4-amino-4,6-dideoxygalactose transaminase